jgi:hypothetical protein
MTTSNLVIDTNFVEDFNNELKNDSIANITDIDGLLSFQKISTGWSFRESKNFKICLLKNNEKIFLLDLEKQKTEDLGVLIKSYINTFPFEKKLEIYNKKGLIQVAIKEVIFEISFSASKKSKLSKEEVVFLFKTLRTINQKIDSIRNDKAIKYYKTEYASLKSKDKKTINMILPKSIIIRGGINCSQIYYPLPSN